MLVTKQCFLIYEPRDFIFVSDLLRIKPLSFVLPTTTIINNTPYHSQVGCYLYENDMGVFSEVVVVGYHELAETKSHRMVHCTCHMHFIVLRLLFE